MADAKSVLYSTYGGFQLKATYQRNLLIANVVVIIIIAGLVAATRLWGNEFVKTDPPNEVEEIASLRPLAPPVVVKEGPAMKVVRPKQSVVVLTRWCCLTKLKKPTGKC